MKRAAPLFPHSATQTVCDENASEIKLLGVCDVLFFYLKCLGPSPSARQFYVSRNSTKMARILSIEYELSSFDVVKQKKNFFL